MTVVKELLYEDVRSKLKNGDILLYKANRLVDKLIRYATKSEYSHSGIIVWWNERLMVMDARSKTGVVIMPLSRNIARWNGDVEWYTSKKNLSKKDRERMIVFAQRELGKKYSAWQAFKVYLYEKFTSIFERRHKNHSSSKLFCSYYVAQIYSSVGLSLTQSKDDCFMSPADIAESKMLEKKGVLKKSLLPRRFGRKKKSTK